MYSAPPNGADSATINPAALNPADLLAAGARGVKRSRSPDDLAQAGSLLDDGDKPRKRGRSMKSRPSGGAPETATQAPLPPISEAAAAPAAAPVQHTPQTPHVQNAPPPPAPTPTYVAAQSSPPKTTPTKSTLKALPTVRDHTTDQLGPGGDEYLPREVDDAGEKKVMPNGQLTGGRQYRTRTFLVPNRGDKLFMLATECARVLNYRDSYLLFNKNRSLYKIIADQVEKDDLVAQEILPFSYRSRQIAIVTARSMFRQFGSRVIVDGRRVRDDYWESKARKQGFTEADAAGDKRPGVHKARDAAAEASQATASLGRPHGEIVYDNNSAFGGVLPQLVPPDYDNTRSRDYSNNLKTGPRQEISGPPYQDRTQPSSLPEIHVQAHHAAEFNRGVNQQREMRHDYLQSMWRRPHEQPTSSGLAQPIGAPDASAPTSRAAASPQSAATGLQQPGMVPAQSPQMMMTAPPYSQPILAQPPVNPGPMRASSTGLPQTTQPYHYSQGQPMWPTAPQAPQQHVYPAYTTQQAHHSPHPQQAAAPQLRHSSTGSVPSSSMSYSGMSGIGHATYSSQTQSMYPADQTPRQYLHQSTAGPPAATPAWSQQQAPAQWWPNQPQ